MKPLINSIEFYFYQYLTILNFNLIYSTTTYILFFYSLSCFKSSYKYFSLNVLSDISKYSRNTSSFIRFLCNISYLDISVWKIKRISNFY